MVESHSGQETFGSEREHGVERVSSTLTKGGPKKGGKASKDHKRVSGPKSVRENLQNLVFTISPVNPEIRKEVGRQRARSSMTGRNEPG